MSYFNELYNNLISKLWGFGFKFEDLPLEKEDYGDEFVLEKIPESMPIEAIIKIKQEITADTSEANAT